MRSSALRVPAMRASRSLHGSGARFSTVALSSRIQRVQESFFKPVDRVVIDVPATTANLGPGFDSFGFALDVWNRVIVERADEFSITVTGEGADRLVADLQRRQRVVLL